MTRCQTIIISKTAMQGGLNSFDFAQKTARKRNVPFLQYWVLMLG